MALLGSAATSALRLHQWLPQSRMRLPNFQLSREYLAMLVQEDSVRQFFFSLVFLYDYPLIFYEKPRLVGVCLDEYDEPVLCDVDDDYATPITILDKCCISKTLSDFFGKNLLIKIPNNYIKLGSHASL